MSITYFFITHTVSRAADRCRRLQQFSEFFMCRLDAQLLSECGVSHGKPTPRGSLERQNILHTPSLLLQGLPRAWWSISILFSFLHLNKYLVED